MGKTKIEWTEATWNPVTGCTKVSPACDHCYAERMSHRLAGRVGYPAEHPFAVTLHPERLEEPLRWKKTRRCFVVSMGDLFHPDVPDEYIAAIFGVMAACPQHTFQVLTKRPDRVRAWFEWIERGEGCLTDGSVVGDLFDHHLKVVGSLPVGALPDLSTPWPLPNVWIGVTAEDQQRADERIPLLLQIPAAKRFVSCEPLLGPIDIDQAMYGDHSSGPGRGCTCFGFTDGFGYEVMLHWVIVGGETGPGARPMHPDLARSLRDQCVAANVPFFLKKMDPSGVRLLDGREWNEMPDL